MAKIFKNAKAATEAKDIMANVRELFSLAKVPKGYGVLAKPTVVARFDPKSLLTVRQNQLGRLQHQTSLELSYQKSAHKIGIIKTEPNANASAITGNGKPTQAVGNTQVDGEPVSMFSGEELLTLTDFTLPGVLPFAWRRLYRTSAVEQRCGMGPGWTHSASP
ncbi:DUF6531 domain-containing protein, partial [Serratia fonticola]|uniref:DUF6531 domain-containing protein n=3 Tax=Serratia TaxID=613 RepID=UPI0021BAA240